MTNDILDNRSQRSEASHLSLETLSAYLDGQLDQSERGLASTHLATCRRCQEELSSLRATTTLLRGLPEMRPARSFQLSPEYAEQGQGAVTGWLGRLLNWMPALRVATAAVAMLLVVVVAGDVLTNQDDGGQERVPLMTDATSTTVSQKEAPTSTEANTSMIEAAAPAAPTTGVDSAAPAGAAAPDETAEEEGAAQDDTEVSVMQAQEGGEADESSAAESAPETSPPAEAAPLEPTAMPEPTATPSPSPTPEPTATPAPSEPTGTSEGRVSNWRIAEVALGLLLVWLVVTLIGANRLRKRT